MRASISMLPFLALSTLALSACATATPSQQSIPVAPAAAFEVPMDPGAIQCRVLSNPNALAAASQWAMGRARAASLASGGPVPDVGTVTSNLAGYCSANPTDTVGSAASQFGF